VNAGTLYETDEKTYIEGDSMEIIKDLKELNGTCYIEVLPGKYNGVCWNAESIFFDEESFSYLEKLIGQIYGEYDHYDFSVIYKDDWNKILDLLDEFMEFLKRSPKSEEMENYVDYFFVNSKENFNMNFNENVQVLKVFITDFQDWIRKQLNNHDYISILGI